MTGAGASAPSKSQRTAHEYEATEHKASIQDLVAQLGTAIDVKEPLKSQGLTSEQASRRLEEEGRNALTPPKRTPEIVKFLLHFTNLFMLLLIGAGILSCVSYAIDRSQPLNLYLGVILFAVVVINCVIAYLQERSSSNVMGTFSNMLPQRCRVIRDGFERDMAVEELVRGDLVRFGVGDKIPADMRVLLSRQAKVENSSITGESVPVTLVPEMTSERPTETKNLAFNGSLCMSGEALGVVIRTGNRTLIGEIAQLAGSQSTKPTTLQVEVTHFVRFIAVLSFAMAVVFFVIGMARGQSFIETFVNGFIVVIVANVPQGLPATVTSVVSVAAKKMAKKNVYVKRLDCVETLGSTSLVASDKTGTLTQNLMTVVSFWYDEEFLHTDGGNTLDSVLMVDLIEDPHFEPLLHCAALCNRARYADAPPEDEDRAFSLGKGRRAAAAAAAAAAGAAGEDDEEPAPQKEEIEVSVRLTEGLPGEERPRKERVITGDASDTAIFRFVNTLGMVDRIRRQYPKVFEVPFNSTIKFSLAIVDSPALPQDPSQAPTPRHTLYLKGAPEIVLEKCSTYLFKGEVRPLDEAFHQSVRTALKRCGIAGQRVLAFAQAHITGAALPAEGQEYSEEAQNYPTAGLTFLGLVALVDPPRPNVPAAVLALKRASIKVIMVTGDHPITAEAIARQVNIIKVGKTVAEVAAMRGVPPSEVSIYDDEVQAVVLSGQELTLLSDEQWTRVLSKREVVFARTTPTQKLEIVERNQELGYVVAVTGDGVNDSPALKAADVGVAMGRMGSDVSREAADIILITDDFGAIVDAVKMGRTIFDNLKKTIAYTLAHLLPEIIPVLCTLAFSIPFGLNSIQILCIDLGTELFPAISLAYEKAEPGIMKRPPRDTKKDRLVSYQLLSYSYLQAGIAEGLSCFLAYFLVFGYYGIPASRLPLTSETYFRPGAPDFAVGDRTYPAAEQLAILAQAQSAWLITLVTCQFWHIWFVRTRRVSTFLRPPNNVVMIFGVIIELCLLVILVYVPFLQPYLGTQDVRALFWAVSLPFLAFIALNTESVIWVSKFHPKGKVARFLAW